MTRLSSSAMLDAVNTVEEVAAFAKVSPRTVMRAIASGELHSLRAGAQHRITDKAVWAWLEEGEEGDLDRDCSEGVPTAALGQLPGEGHWLPPRT